MKLLLASLLICPAVAFAPIAQGSVNPALSAGAYEPMEGEGKINLKIDLESKKVVNMEDLAVGDKKVYCRCWLSGTFPLCDGTHAKHNDATGDNVGPLIVSGPKKE